MFTKILDYNIFNGSKIELMNQLKNFKKINIISGNPEVLYRGLEDKTLFEFYTNSNSIIIPDGVGTVMASKITKDPVREKIAGIEVMDEIIKKCHKEQKGIYLLGAKEEVLSGCKINLSIKYPGLNILGTNNGYFDIYDCRELIEDIKKKKPYVLFVAMGCPRQEIFIHNYFNELPCEVFMGVGGSFDVFAGEVKRAPKWMIDFGLEWLHRVIKEPFRIKRLTYIPKFLIRVVLKTYKK